MIRLDYQISEVLLEGLRGRKTSLILYSGIQGPSVVTDLRFLTNRHSFYDSTRVFLLKALIGVYEQVL